MASKEPLSCFAQCSHNVCYANFIKRIPLLGANILKQTGKNRLFKTYFTRSKGFPEPKHRSTSC